MFDKISEIIRVSDFVTDRSDCELSTRVFHKKLTVTVLERGQGNNVTDGTPSFAYPPDKQNTIERLS